MTTDMKSRPMGKLTLADSRRQEIQQRLNDELLPAIRSVDQELAQIETTKANWRDTVANPANVERVEDDRKRLVNRRTILTEARERAEAELRQAEAQVQVDVVAELRAEFERIGNAREQRARDIVAAAETLAAMVVEDDLQREKMVGIVHRAKRFFVGRASGPEEMRRSDAHAELLRLLKPMGERSTMTDLQHGIESVLAKNIPAHLWSSEMTQGGRAPDTVAKIGGQCRGGLIAMDECMKKLIDDAKGN